MRGNLKGLSIVQVCSRGDIHPTPWSKTSSIQGVILLWKTRAKLHRCNKFNMCQTSFLWNLYYKSSIHLIHLFLYFARGRNDYWLMKNHSFTSWSKRALILSTLIEREREETFLYNMNKMRGRGFQKC